MLLFLEHTFLLLSHPSFTTKVFPAFLRCCRHPAAANPVGEDISGVLVTRSGYLQAFMCEHISYVHWFKKMVLEQ